MVDHPDIVGAAQACALYERFDSTLCLQGNLGGIFHNNTSTAQNPTHQRNNGVDSRRNEDFDARSSYLGHGYVITSHSVGCNYLAMP